MEDMDAATGGADRRREFVASHLPDEPPARRAKRRGNAVDRGEEGEPQDLRQEGKEEGKGQRKKAKRTKRRTDTHSAGLPPPSSSQARRQRQPYQSRQPQQQQQQGEPPSAPESRRDSHLRPRARAHIEEATAARLLEDAVACAGLWDDLMGQWRGWMLSLRQRKREYVSHHLREVLAGRNASADRGLHQPTFVEHLVLRMALMRDGHDESTAEAHLHYLLPLFWSRVWPGSRLVGPLDYPGRAADVARSVECDAESRATRAIRTPGCRSDLAVPPSMPLPLPPPRGEGGDGNVGGTDACADAYAPILGRECMLDPQLLDRLSAGVWGDPHLWSWLAVWSASQGWDAVVAEALAEQTWFSHGELMASLYRDVRARCC